MLHQTKEPSTFSYTTDLSVYQEVTTCREIAIHFRPVAWVWWWSDGACLPPWCWVRALFVVSRFRRLWVGSGAGKWKEYMPSVCVFLTSGSPISLPKTADYTTTAALEYYFLAQAMWPVFQLIR